MKHFEIEITEAAEAETQETIPHLVSRDPALAGKWHDTIVRSNPLK